MTIQHYKLLGVGSIDLECWPDQCGSGSKFLPGRHLSREHNTECWGILTPCLSPVFMDVDKCTRRRLKRVFNWRVACQISPVKYKSFAALSAAETGLSIATNSSSIESFFKGWRMFRVSIGHILVQFRVKVRSHKNKVTSYKACIDAVWQMPHWLFMKSN